MATAKGKITVKVEGLDKIIKELQKLSDKGEKAIYEYVQESAEEVKDEAKKLVTVDRGNLKNNIISKLIHNDSIGVVFVVGAKYPKAAYAHIIEFGSRFQRPQPFLRPAADKFKNKALGIASRKLKKALGL
jgi:HK97 gp10 family phage protein